MALSDVRRLVKIVLVVLAGALAFSGCAMPARSAGRPAQVRDVPQYDAWELLDPTTGLVPIVAKIAGHRPDTVMAG